MKRNFKYDIMKEIQNRWSPRAFKNETISKDDLLPLIEAARYAPSCFNEQPWKFIIAYKEEQLNTMRSVLLDSNRLWADRAPSFIMIISKKIFSLDGKENYWSKFDAGTAWGYLSLEAEKMGFITHAMGGFKKDLAREKFNIPDDYDILTIIAVGKLGEKDTLPTDDLRDREKPGLRKPLEDIFIEDRFK
ncbi:nitroreductase [Clostridium tetanomorphum]|uniref:nitroreductase family protein n=1 Tax=Clostridium tetanomorphum TaxID=1553 RepID=UPI0004450F63|nr:nitroreductase family protein [Clostridium tetanomorphum]KAJ52504.1 nitroreductase family protein [Clostridium tetanomorphum DSM 665]MBP1864183.1 nitroreductase [Clostridium tetanomorphum]NRS84596.1 nitroreductase [Clostridium tetanomorphum]SQB91904.1 nitroreductase family protein [Clostridium tetanomorphum]